MGGYLIHAFISGKSIQQVLILEGLVRVAYLYDEYNYSDLYLAAEKKAKESAQNIWSIPGYVNKTNGFDMDVVSEDLKESIVEKAGELMNIFKQKRGRDMKELKINLLNLDESNNQEIIIEIKGKSNSELELTLQAIDVLIHSIEDTCREDPECYKEASTRIKYALKSTDEWVR
ncbi:hypothetical protein HMPREF1013_05076 [Bacillus sp. 2_A_57_CT2]|nr:hypothetical protein HMPREF1013_05076 [Bacillus sp. 2_A_57_CT2]